MKSNKPKWATIGRLWKDPRKPEKLRGEIKIDHLGIKFKVYAFIKTANQKKFPNEEDIRISMIVNEIDSKDNPF